MKHLLRIFALSFLGLSLSHTAQAAGYQLNEYSATNMGRSFAGIGVAGDDFSAIAYNPAGMSFNQTSGIQGGAALFRLYSHFKGTDGDRRVNGGQGRTGRGHTSIERLMPNIFAQYRVNDQLTTGIGLYVPYGLATDYPNGWFGERHGALSEITVINLSPAASYKINDIFSVGAALNIQYATAHLTSSGSDVGGDAWGTGYSIGFTIKPIDQLRFGLSYRSKVNHQLKGQLDRLTLPTAMGPMNFSGDVRAKITTPETAILSAAWDINDNWTLTGTARWTRWKRFDTLNIILDSDAPAPYSHLVSSTPEKWRNTGFYALGVDYRANQNWTIRGGLGYDMTVIRSGATRTPRIPDGRRVWNSLGFSYTHNNMQIDFGYAHIFVYGGHAKGTDSLNAAYGKPDIKYSSDANMFSLGFQYKF